MATNRDRSAHRELERTGSYVNAVSVLEDAVVLGVTPAEHPVLADVRKRGRRIGAVDLPGEAMPVEDRVGDEPRRHAVPDPVQPTDPFPDKRLRAGLELTEERLVRDAAGHEDDAVDVPGDPPPLVVDVEGGDRARLDRCHGVLCDDLDAQPEEGALDPRKLERVLGERRDLREGRDERDAVSLPAELLRERASHVVAVAVVDDDASPGLAACPRP